MSTNEHVTVLEPMADTMDKFRALSASLKANAAALRRDGVWGCCAGTYDYAAAHIDAIVRESDAQVPVAATLDEAAADPALTLDVARELLRDAAAGIRSLIHQDRTTRGARQVHGARRAGEGEQSMTTINDGGPAFPVWELNGQGKPEMTGFGMSLRDYFAAKAMQGLAANPEAWDMTDEKVAEWAYNAADAMLAAREQGESEAECSHAPAEGIGEREYMDEIMCDVPGLAAAIWEEREREEFEAWFSDEWQHPKAVERDAAGYKLAAAQNAWTAWQAGWLAALAAQQQEPKT